MAATYNHNGGTLTQNDCAQLDLYKYFNPSVFDSSFESVSKLRTDSSVLIEPFVNKIVDFHLNQSEIMKELLDTHEKHQIATITGNAGVGKSALLKDYLRKDQSITNVFVFKAEQFNESTLAQVFTRLGVTDSITDIINSISFLRVTLIVIDSLEKLLETSPENAFQQF